MASLESPLSETIRAQARAASQASAVMRQLTAEQKNTALYAIANLVRERREEILEANARDLLAVGEISEAFRRRLILNDVEVEGLAVAVENVARLDDPVGMTVYGKRLENGLELRQVRIPLGVVACIYESRPNVTLDIAVLSIKSGNACILRGGREALATSTALSSIVCDAVSDTAVPEDAVQLVTQTEHQGVSILAGLDEYISVIIPRGGPNLIDNVTQHATMTVLKHREGNTHVFVDSQADTEKALAIILDGKVRNPSVCNSLEHVVVHGDIAGQFVPHLVAALRHCGVEVRGCERVRALSSETVPVVPSDWATEYLDFILSILIVNDFDEGLAHVVRYSSGLSDAIVTQDLSRANRFVAALDGAAVYVNASTRFTDGATFGLGAEVGISTAPVHGKGPMGLESLTTTRFELWGDGQVRG